MLNHMETTAMHLDFSAKIATLFFEIVRVYTQ